MHLGTVWCTIKGLWLERVHLMTKLNDYLRMFVYFVQFPEGQPFDFHFCVNLVRADCRVVFVYLLHQE